MPESYRVSRRWVAVLALAVVVPLSACGSTTGSPAPLAAPATPTPGDCSPDQVSVVMTGLDAGASQRYAALTVTARPGRSCRLAGPLDVALRGANDLVVDREAPGTPTATATATATRAPTGTSAATPVTVIDPAHSASATLHWTVAADRETTPASLDVRWSGADVDVPWTGGPVGDDPDHRTVTVGPLTAGTPQG